MEEPTAIAGDRELRSCTPAIATGDRSQEKTPRGAQAYDPIFVPPPKLVPWMTRFHVWAYERTNGRIGGNAGGMRHIILYTRGRRSGRNSAACLPIWLDRRGSPILVASNAGNAHHPAWYHNATDSRANRTVRVRDGVQMYRASILVLGGEERRQIWYELTTDRPFYGRYQEKTSRLIPLVRLIRVGA